jgi:Tfp pilus assembly protein PilF
VEPNPITPSSLGRLALFCAGTLLLAASSGRAQTGAAYGKVVDEQGRPVEGALVEFDFQGPVARHHQTNTDKKGRFRQFLLYGGWNVTVSKKAYRSAGTGVKVTAGEASPISDVVLMSLAAATEAATDRDPILGPFKKATALAEAGRLDEAQAIYEELLQKGASLPEVHFNLGTVHYQKKRLDRAAAEFRRVLALVPNHRGAFVGLSRAYEDEGQNDKALEVMRQAAAAHPGDAKIHHNLGILSLNARRLDEAKAAFEKAVALDPRGTDALYVLATIALNQGEVAEAIRRLEQYLEQAPADAPHRASATKLLAELQKASARP